jgi:hypothetical protein
MDYRPVHRAIWYFAPEGLQNASCRLQSNVSSYTVHRRADMRCKYGAFRRVAKAVGNFLWAIG